MSVSHWRRRITRARVDIYGVLAVDDDAVLLSIPTSTSPQTITVFTGALGGDLSAAPRNLTFTTSAAVGAYTTDPWTITSTSRARTTITENPALTQVNGGETVTALAVHATLLSIQIPAMGSNGGTIKIGVGARVGLLYRPFLTASGFPYAVPHVDSAALDLGTVPSISAVGAAPYGAFDFAAAIGGTELAAVYAEDLS